MYPRAKHAICLSHEFKNILNKCYHVSKEKISVIPYGFQLNGLRKFDALSNKRIKIICVRRLVKRVGVDLLIKACKLLNDEGLDFELNVVGEGYMHNELQSLIDELDLNHKVTLYGRISDNELKNKLLTSDLAVMPSIALEGFGITTVECLYHGVPVIGTNVGGTKEILRPLNPDLIIEYPSAEKIYEKMKAVISKEILLPSRNDCHEYSKNFDIEKIGPQIRNVYHSVLSTSSLEVMVEDRPLDFTTVADQLHAYRSN